MSANITPVLDDAEMRELGFTDHREGFWYYSQSLGDGITFNVSIDKATGEWSEYVLDEDFGQPYYYGRYGLADEIRMKVDTQVKLLRSHGILVGVDHRGYGCAQ